MTDPCNKVKSKLLLTFKISSACNDTTERKNDFSWFQLSQCSLISDFGFGAGKSLRSVKRSVDCLIGAESTSYWPQTRAGDKGNIYAFFSSFPEFLFLFTLDARGETTRLQQTKLRPDAFNFSLNLSRTLKSLKCI